MRGVRYIVRGVESRVTEDYSVTDLQKQGGYMLVQISNSIILNTDQIVTIERGETPVDMTVEVRITLLGRMGHVTATGPAASNLWEWFTCQASDYRLDFKA